MIDLVNLEKNKISNDLREYVIGIYSGSGNGKTTLAADFPKPIFLATDIGFKALSVYAQPVFNWTDILTFKGQLALPAVKEKFDTVVIDTLDMMMFYLESFVCQKHGVKAIGDVPYGKGYSDLKKELRQLFSDIQSLGYGIVLVGHDKAKSNFKEEDDPDIGIRTLALSDSLFNIVWGLADIFAYIDVSADGKKRELCFRKTENYNAKSRFREIVPTCPLSYDALLKSVQDAIEAEAKLKEGTVVTSERQFHHEQNVITYEEFDKLKEDTLTLASTLLVQYPNIVQEIIEKYFVGRKISDANKEDAGALQLILEELQQL